MTVRVPAKVNLQLSVGPVRSDGYHELATVFQAVGLYDEIVARVPDEPGIRLTVSGEGEGSLPLGEGNLAGGGASIGIAERMRSNCSVSWLSVVGARSHHCAAGPAIPATPSAVTSTSAPTMTAAPTTSGIRNRRRSQRTGVASTKVMTTATITGASSGCAAFMTAITASTHRPLIAQPAGEGAAGGVGAGGTVARWRGSSVEGPLIAAGGR